VVLREEDDGSGEMLCLLESPVCGDVPEAVECVVDYWLARIAEDLPSDVSGDVLTPDEEEQLRQEIRSQAEQGQRAFEPGDYTVLKEFSYDMTLSIRSVPLSANLVRKIQAMKPCDENAE